jgi:hypothetical protein
MSSVEDVVVEWVPGSLASQIIVRVDFARAVSLEVGTDVDFPGSVSVPRF